MARAFVLAVMILGALSPPASAQDAKAGEAVFKRACAICHFTAEGKNMVGPSLFGVVDRKAGSVPNFRYSAANRSSDMVWSTEKLDPYLTAPREVVPGTTMTYAGLKDKAQRADLIAYLATLK